VRASAKGRFRITARHSSVTVGATVWQMEDRCDGTLTKVRRGRAVVRNIRRRRNVTLTSGQSYLARAPG
jgi:ferric-dicitrate binding protein FerR (iron transport regulator)